MKQKSTIKKKAGYKNNMHFLKKNFILIFLIVSSIAMGVLAFVTALRLREFRQTPQQVSALTPTCKFTFTITDATPRQELVTPTISLLAQQGVTPIITVVPTATPTLKPTATTKPTTTLKPTSTTTPSPTKSLGGLTGITPTATPKVSPTTITPTTTKTVTPTKVAEPNLPVSGTNLPTMGALLLGIVLIGMGIFSGGFLFLSGK